MQTAAIQEEIKKQLAATDFKGLVTWKLKGSDQERQDASAFLGKAFGAAIFLIFAVLLAQFNKLTSVALVLFAIVLSTIGVFIGLIVTGQAFGVVMTGDRHHRACRHRHQQQHRADRHLRSPAARGRSGGGSDPAEPAASAPGRCC